MTRIVVDSWAWVEYLNGTSSGQVLKDIIEKKENELFTSMISLAEVLSFACRKNMDIDVAEAAIISNSKISDVDRELSKEAAVFHAKMRGKIKDFGLGDSFVVITARRLNAKILTGDPHFKGMKEAIMIDK